MIAHLIAKAKPQKGGVFLWQDDWDAVVRKLERLEKEVESLKAAISATSKIGRKDW